VISGVSTDESSQSHNHFAKIFCICLTGILLLAATVRSFAHMPFGISDRNSSQWAGFS